MTPNSERRRKKAKRGRERERGDGRRERKMSARKAATNNAVRVLNYYQKLKGHVQFKWISLSTADRVRRGHGVYCVSVCLCDNTIVMVAAAIKIKQLKGAKKYENNVSKCCTDRARGGKNGRPWIIHKSIVHSASVHTAQPLGARFRELFCSFSLRSRSWQQRFVRIFFNWLNSLIVIEKFGACWRVIPTKTRKSKLERVHHRPRERKWIKMRVKFGCDSAHRTPSSRWISISNRCNRWLVR